MILWNLVAAFALPPEGVDPDAVERYERLADGALNGPAGCWEFEGTVRESQSWRGKAGFWSRADETVLVDTGTWTGRLDDGVWVRFDGFDDSEERRSSGLHVGYIPMLGRVDPKVATRNGEPVSEGRKDENGNVKKTDPINPLRKVISSLDASTAVSQSTWREGLSAIQLDQDIPLTDDRDPQVLHLTTLFPQGGDLPSRISATFPREIVRGSWPLKLRLYDTQLHVVQRQVRDKMLPQSETVSTVASAVGFTIGYEQRIDYRKARPCD